MKYYIMRHGKTKGNEEGRYLPPDEHLSEAGIRELKEKRDAGLYLELERALLTDQVFEEELQRIPLFISPHIRCRETAELLFPGVSCHVIDEFREIDFGRFTGKNYAELNKSEEYQRWIDSNGELPFPEGESKSAYIRRVKEGLQRIRTLMKESERSSDIRSDARNDEDGHVVIIAHAGTIMAVNEVITGSGYFDISPEFGEIFCFSIAD